MSVVGVALAGGASRRMGRDKALMVVDGERLVDRTLRKLASVCEKVVVADRGRNLVEGLSAEDGPGRGPAAGILGAAACFPNHDLLVLACDMPEVPEGLLEALTQEPGHLVIPRTIRGFEPLCALYRPAALVALRERVGRDLYSLHPLAEESGLEVFLLEGEALEPWGDTARLFHNINRPDDLQPLARIGPERAG